MANDPGILRRIADTLTRQGPDPSITASVSDSPAYQLYLRDQKEVGQAPLTYNQWAQKRFEASTQPPPVEPAAPNFKF